MNLADFVAGAFVALVVAGALGLAAVDVRRRLLAGWSGAAARVAEAVLALGVLTFVLELLGVAGVLDRWTMVAASVTAAGIMVVLARRHPIGVATTPTAAPAPRRVTDRVAGVGAVCAVVVVGVQWTAISLSALRSGMQGSIDTLWYHGPTAARFAQTGSITAVHFFDDNAITAYFPGGAALLHAGGILAFGNDVLSPILNLGFLALALAAAWAIGSAVDAGAYAVLAVAIVLGVPGLVGTQPGGSYTDVIGVALVLASVALLVNGRVRGFALALAAVAAGLAVGAKLTMLAPVGALSIAVILVAGRGRRLRVALMWFATLGALGGLWYVRNLVVAGNPLPGLELNLGPLSLPPMPSTTPVDDVASYLTNWKIVREIFVPGLDGALGAGWWAILAGTVLGSFVVVCRARERVWRAVGAVAAVSFIAFLFSPQYLGLPGFPFFFEVNVRYAAPAFALGLVSLVAVPRAASNRGRVVLLAYLSVVFVLTELSVSALWSAPVADTVAAVVVVGAVLAVSFVAVRSWPSWQPRIRVAIAVATLVVVVGALWVGQRDYIDHRYHDATIGNRPVVAALRDREGVRIGTLGFFLQYSLYGPDLSNHVQYLGERGPHGSFHPPRTCAAFARIVNEGHYDYVLIAPPSYPAPSDKPAPALEWAHQDVAALREIAYDGTRASVFKVTGRLDPKVCPAD